MAFKDLWNLVKKKSEKKSDRPINHEFSDDDRELSAEIRRLKLEKQKILNEMAVDREKIQLEKQKLELEELKAELYGDDEDEETPKNDGSAFNPEALLMMILAKGFAGNHPQQGQTTLGNFQAGPSTHPESPTNQGQVQLEKPQISDEEIRNFLRSQNPSHLKMAKTLPKTAVFRMVTQQLPLTNEEFERAYTILQGEF